MENKFLNQNGLLYLWQKIKNMFVAKEDGKGLSSNDYTTNEKIKLSGIAEGANKTIIQDNLASTSPTDALSANQGKILDEKINAINTNMENLGAGDMLKAKYDVDNNGQVDKADDADKLGGQSPSYYAKSDELSQYVSTSKVGQANGVASLGADGKVPESQLPETAPIEHTHEMSDITGLIEASEEIIESLNDKSDKNHQHEISEVNGLQDELDEMVAVAQGKCKSYVFDTVDEMNTWLAETSNTVNLKTGDVFLIRAVDVPDYWWDADTSSTKILETTKVDLTTITNAEIDAIVAS